MVPGDPYQLAPLLQQSQTGDAQALNALLGRLRPYLQALVRSWLGPDLAGRLGDSDIVQEALLRASCHFADFRGQSVPELLGWLKRIAYRAASDRKRQAVSAAPQAGELLEQVPWDGMMPPEILEREEDAVRLAAAMERLSQRRREVVQLRLLDGLDFPEIGRRLGGSAGSLRVLFLRAVQQLRMFLGTGP
jgi:RNA polymerase sigma-70 factor (ECF subfamily)